MSQQDPIDRQLSTFLTHALRHHGVKLQRREDWLVGPRGTGIQANEAGWREQDGHVLLQLDLHVAMPDGALITESFAGAGTDRSTALQQAMQKFCQNSLHVILVACFGQAADEQVECEPWQIGDSRWQVVMGAFNQTATTEQVPPPPQGLIDSLRGAVQELLLEGNCHWIRFFHAQTPGHEPTVEALLDNEDWPAGRAALAAVDWPESGEYLALRQFLVLRRDPPIETPPHPEPAQIVRGIAVLRECWGRGTELDETTVFRRMIREQVSAGIAERILSFVPLAYGEVLLEGARLPRVYRPYRNGRPGSEQQFATEPCYLIGLDQARAADEEELRHIGSWSASYHVAEQLLEGRPMTPENLAEFEWVPFLIPSHRFHPPEAGPRPWWRFW